MENKKVGFLINSFDLKEDQATTFLLRKISSFVKNMYIFSVNDFIGTEDVHALHLDVSIEESFDIHFELSGLERERVHLASLDLIMIRTNPARDIHNNIKHTTALNNLVIIESRGVPIINSPTALLRMHDKRYLFNLPSEIVPVGSEIKNRDELVNFFNHHNQKIVIKPFVGTRGNGVQLIDNVNLIDNEIEYPILGQEYVQSSNQADKRVCLFDGDVIEIEGVDGVVARVPSKGEFRSNISLGGSAEPSELSDLDKITIAKIKPWLLKNGLRYVGLDLLGGKIIEINCFSPGGIQDYERFYNKPFGDYLIGSILEEI